MLPRCTDGDLGADAFATGDRRSFTEGSTSGMDEKILEIQGCMYQYSRAIYRSIKDLIDPYVDPETRLDYRRSVLDATEQTVERLAADPHYFAKPDRALFQDIRRYFPITAQ